MALTFEGAKVLITYTLLAAIMLILVFLAEFLFIKSGLLSIVQFWIAMGIVTFFQLLSNGYLTSQLIVIYNPKIITGVRIAFAPFEDLYFGFALVSLTLFVWANLKPSKSKPVKTKKNKHLG